MRALLDVNILLALFDSGHVFHGRARDWWRANRDLGWASCPLTENGYLRIVSQKNYQRPVRLPDALAQFRNWAVPPLHEFWPDDLSLLDAARIDYAHVLGPKQITDIYLLALAVKHGGRLVTLDRGISFAVAKGATSEQLVTI
jgi:toxin-antitoxin system PIN domain toxin